MNRTSINRLGYVLATLIICLIVWTGYHFIKTDSQLIMVLTGMVTLILSMGVVTVCLRSGRYTKREVESGKVYRQVYDTMTKTERRFFQSSIILMISMFLLGLIQKGPDIWKIVAPFF